MLRAGGRLDGAAVVGTSSATPARHRADVRQPAAARSPTTARPTRRPPLVAKLPAADETSRATAPTLRSYEKEVRFYQQLARRLADPHADACSTPTSTTATARASCCCSRTSRRPSQGDQLVGCTPGGGGRSRCDELVGLHAPRWGDPTLAEHRVAARRPRDRDRDSCSMLLPMLWAGFTRALRRRPRRRRRTRPATRCSRSSSAYLTADRRPWTVVHGDYRLDNLLFDPPTAASPGVVDWQTCTHGPALSDVAYFIGAGPAAPTTGASTRSELVRGYHARPRRGRRHRLRLGPVLARLPARHLGRADHGHRRVDARRAHRPRRRDVPHHGRRGTPATRSTSTRPSCIAG